MRPSAYRQSGRAVAAIAALFCPHARASLPSAPKGATFVLALLSGRSRENNGLLISLSLSQGLFSRAPPPPHPRRCLMLASSVASLRQKTADAPSAFVALRHPQAKGSGSRAPPSGGSQLLHKKDVVFVMIKNNIYKKITKKKSF